MFLTSGLLALGLALTGCAGAGASDPAGASGAGGDAVTAAASEVSRTDSGAVIPSGYVDGAVTLVRGTDGVGLVTDTAALGDTPVVSEWFDLHCPYCAMFADLHGSTFEGLLDSGDAALGLYPMAFLDDHSAGDAYSTRGAVLLAAIADSGQGAAWWPTLQGLMGAQPESGTGMSDARMLEIATEAGVDTTAALSSFPDLTVEQALAQKVFADYVAEPAQAAFHSGIEQVPTVKVGGAEVTSIGDATAFDAEPHALL